LSEIDALEKRFNCKLVFPSTEQATDELVASGPAWQAAMFIDEILVSVL